MRVAITVNSLRRDGGAERMVCVVANALASEGHDVAIFTRVPSVFGHQPISDAVSVTQLYLPRGPKWLRNLQLPFVVASLRGHVSRFRADVALGQQWHGAILSLLATLRTGIGNIAWEQGYLPAAHLSTPWRILRRFTYPNAAAVVLVNRASVERASQLIDPQRIHVIPNFPGVWPTSPSSGQSSASSTWREFVGTPTSRLVALGRLEPEKGFDLLIDSFAQIAGEFPEWGLLIVGDGSQRNLLMGLVERYGLQGRVCLPGAVADPWPTLHESDAFVFPSRHEGFGLALVEAMGAGLPVVAFDCPAGPGEIITDGIDGLLVPAEDTAALAEALRRLLSSQALRDQLAQNATAVRKRLSQDRMMDIWGRLLRSVAGVDGH